jgi:Mg/Co/Ni transporter MgtE
MIIMIKIIEQTIPDNNPLPASLKATLNLLCSSISPVEILRTVYRQPLLAVIVGGSLTCAMTVGTLVGSMIPLLMNKLKIDPAVSSGPFIPTVIAHVKLPPTMTANKGCR